MKHIDPRKLTRKKVCKFPLPWKTAEDIENELNSINVPAHIIVHVGSNNIPMDSPDTCAKKLKSFVIKTKAKFPNTKTGFFEITFRQDIYLATNIKEVNKKLKDEAKHKVVFIDNSFIDNTCLNGNNLHLNGKGSDF